MRKHIRYGRLFGGTGDTERHQTLVVEGSRIALACSAEEIDLFAPLACRAVVVAA